METIKKIYRIGYGPSSSHTMGPQKAAKRFLNQYPNEHHYSVTLFGSLAATGKGHLTDVAIESEFGERHLTIIWKPEIIKSFHPNAMLFESFDENNNKTHEWEIYSIGGGALSQPGETPSEKHIYKDRFMDDILRHCEDSGETFWEFVFRNDEKDIEIYLKKVWKIMQETISNGLQNEGVLPGGLGVSRKASVFYRKAKMTGEHFRRSGIVSSYALAVAEENAGGGLVVTAPTCGSCGVLPAVLRYLQEVTNCSEDIIIRALATAGLIGALVKQNASISGAEVGCQGEIGTACAMASAAAVQIMGGTIRQIEYAAEMGLEHHLGLTCDPVEGLVQIPCIERNAFAAKRALSCADYALFSDGHHRISFDKVVRVMKKTGHDLPSLYKETSTGGLAKYYKRDCH